MNIRALILALLIQDIHGYWNWGFCPIVNPTPVGFFEVEKYAGNWYEIMRDKDVFYEQGDECVHTTYQKTLRPFYQINVLNR